MRFNVKMFIFGGENANIKFATAMKAAWNVKFVGFIGKNSSNTRENGC
jgi:hypothetical protein